MVKKVAKFDSILPVSVFSIERVTCINREALAKLAVDWAPYLLNLNIIFVNRDTCIVFTAFRRINKLLLVASPNDTFVAGGREIFFARSQVD